MCRPKAPHFFGLGRTERPPFSNIYICLFHFPTQAAPKDPTFKSIRFFVIFSSTPPPHFSLRGRSESPPPPIFSEGPLPKLPKLWAAHIYIPLSYMSTPRGSVKQRSFIYEFSFVFLSFLYVCLSNKGHLLMSFPSFFFRFCLCVCLSNKVHLLIIFLLFWSARCVCVWGGYSHIRAVRVCAARKPPPPHFSAWAAPKDSTFSIWTASKDPPFQKYTFDCLFHFSVSLLFLVPTPTPRFSLRGRSESPHFQ